MTRPFRTSKRGATFAALFVTFLWSSSWVIIRFGLDSEELPPLTFAGLRYGMAAAILAGWVLARSSHRASVRTLGFSDWRRIVVLGVVFYGVTQGAQFVAIDNQPAATTSLVLSITPLVVALTSGRALGESPRPLQWAGGVVVLAGAALYFGGELGATVVGMTAAVVGLGANAASALLGRRINRRPVIAPVTLTALSMGIGAMGLVGTGLAVEGLPIVSLRAWVLVGWLAVVNTAVAFTLWNLSLSRLTAMQSVGINNTMLIQIALLGWLFLDEVPGLTDWLAIAMVTLGVLWIQFDDRTSLFRRSARPAGAEEPHGRP